MTQSELARRAGYSERLIVKAEAGNAITLSAMEDLAEVLSDHSQVIYAEDLAADSIGLAKAYNIALYIHREKIMEHITPFLDEEIIMRVNGDPAVIPFAGEWHGIAGVTEAFRRYFGCLEFPSGYDHTKYFHYVAQGTDVVMWGECWAFPRGGKPMTSAMPVSVLMRFRRGKMYLLDDRFDTQKAMTVLQQGE